MYFESFPESGFSGRRRSRDQYHTYTFLKPSRDLFGNLSNLLGLISFGHLNDFRHAIFTFGTVQIAHVIKSANLQKLQVLAIHVQQLLLLNLRLQFHRILTLWHTQQVPSIMRLNIKHGDIPRGGGQATVKIIDIFFQLRIACIQHVGCLKQAGLVLHAPLAKELHYLCRLFLYLHKRDIGFHNFPHPFSDGIELRLSYRHI